jgi:transcriptional regulator with XRE-family HTH domain
MTPFGAKIRQLREARGITQKDMAKALGVSAAYLSALEHGNRSRPGWHFMRKLISYLGVIWDDADELMELAELSDPKVSIDTRGLTPEATEMANRLALCISNLPKESLLRMLEEMRIHGTPEARLAPPPVFAEKSPGRLLPTDAGFNKEDEV